MFGKKSPKDASKINASIVSMVVSMLSLFTCHKWCGMCMLFILLNLCKKFSLYIFLTQEFTSCGRNLSCYALSGFVQSIPFKKIIFCITRMPKYSEKKLFSDPWTYTHVFLSYYRRIILLTNTKPLSRKNCKVRDYPSKCPIFFAVPGPSMTIKFLSYSYLFLYKRWHKMAQNHCVEERQSNYMMNIHCSSIILCLCATLAVIDATQAR